MDLVGNGLDQRSQEAGGGLDVGDPVQLNEGILGGPVHGHEEVQLAFLGANLGNIDVEVADGIALERLLGGFVAGDLRQSADAMALKASVQSRAGEARYRRLQSVEAVIQRQQRV